MSAGPQGRRVLWLGACLVLAPCAAGAESQGDRLSFRPSVTLSFEATDNGLQALDGTDTEWTYGAALEPRLELEYERPRLRAGTAIGADLRYSVDEPALRDAFLDLSAFVEWELLRGLTLRISDQFVPQAVRLGSPSDDVRNLRQSNLAMVELNYRRELRRRRAVELGVRGSRFDSQGFAASLDLDADGLPDLVGNLRSDYWSGAAYLEAQQSLGRHSLVYLRGELRERTFDEIPRSDFSEWSSQLGLRSQIAKRLELDMALGYGSVDYDDLPSDSRLIGRAELDYVLPRGWGLQGAFVQRFSAGAGGTDFDESTARFGVSKVLGQRTRASAGLLWTRFRADSPDSDANRVTAFDLSLERQLTRRIKAVLAWQRWRNSGSADDDDFTQNRVTLGFTYAR